MRATDDCHHHDSKLAPTLRSVIGFVEVSLASSDVARASRHEMRFRDSTRFSFGMFFRPRIVTSATNALASSNSSSLRLTFPSPSRIPMPPFGFTFAREDQEHFTRPFVKMDDFHAPKRLRSIDLSRNLRRTEALPTTTEVTPFPGSPPNAPSAVLARTNGRGFGRRRSCDFATAIRRPTSVHSKETFSFVWAFESAQAIPRPKSENSAHDVVDRLLQHDHDSWAPHAIELVPRVHAADRLGACRCKIEVFGSDGLQLRAAPYSRTTTGRDSPSREWFQRYGNQSPGSRSLEHLVVTCARVRALESTSPNHWSLRTGQDSSADALPRRMSALRRIEVLSIVKNFSVT